MSAFVVSKHDIDILVTAYAGLNPAGAPLLDLDKLGRKLWRENVDSVAYRYDMPQRHGAEYAGYLEAIAAYAHEPLPAKRAAVRKIADCYDYQSCEHPAWEASEAKQIVDAIGEAFRREYKTKAWEDAPWGISGDADLAKVRV
jgi:hypothetical protein